MRKLLFAFVYSNALIALAVSFSLLATQNLLKIPYDYYLAAFAGFATVFTYSMQRIIRFPEDVFSPGSDGQYWLARNKNKMIIFSCTAGISAFIMAWRFPLKIWIFLILFGALSFLYAGKFIRINGTLRGLREIPYSKVFWISFTWVAITVWLPLLVSPAEVERESVWFLSFERFLLITALSIPFDVRDLPYDYRDQKTFPQILGVKKSNYFSIILLLIWLGMFFYQYSTGSISSLHFGIQIIFGAVMMGLISQVSEHQPDIYFSGYLDGVLLIYGILIFILP